MEITDITQPQKKKKIKDYVRNWYRNLSEEKKNKKREYGRNKYHTMNKVC